MTLIDLLRSPWAIVPDRLDEIQAIYTAHLRGDKIDIDAIEARLGRPLANDQQEYRVEEGGVAVLELSGAISPKANLFTRVSGGASAQVFAQQIESMRADPRVRAIVLDVDSPGGNVLGLPAAAEAVRALAAEKPTVTVCSGMMASGGYWIGSASNAVYISGLTDMVGSIGVVATHTFDPKSAAGRQRTEITAGKYKRIASDTAPLTAEGKAYMQAQVDEIYRVFVDTVAQNRRASAEQVLQHMADGRVFVGQQAIDAGLVDGVATVDAMVERLASDPQKFAARRKAAFALGGLPAAGAAADVLPVSAEAGPVRPEASTQPSEVHMTPTELAVKFAAENPDAAAVLRAEGSTAELDRVKAVKAAALPGHEALIEQLAMDGKTSGAEAALAVIAAERGKTASAAAARAADAPPPVRAGAIEEDQPKPKAASTAYRAGETTFNVEAGAAKLDADAKAHMQAHPGTDYIQAIKAVTTKQEA
jgi:signal peptide peptidase SppA